MDHFVIPEIKNQTHPSNILDVTLRDGSFQVNFEWNESEINNIIDHLYSAGIRLIELGYVGGLPSLHGKGITSNIDPFQIKRIISKYPDVKFIVMIHPSGTSPVDFSRLREVGVSTVRIVFHNSWKKKFENVFQELKDCGLNISLNLALSSRYSIEEIKLIIDYFNSLSPDLIYLADTCAALFPKDVEELYSLLKKRVDNQIRLGFHGHNSLGLALANSLVAIENGASMIDSSILGLGRGAGNLDTLVWAIVNSSRGGTKYDIGPILEAGSVLKEKVLKYRSYNPNQYFEELPFLISGAFNLTPPEEDNINNVARRLRLPLRDFLIAFVASFNSLTSLNEEYLYNFFKK